MTSVTSGAAGGVGGRRVKEAAPGADPAWVGFGVAVGVAALLAVPAVPASPSPAPVTGLEARAAAAAARVDELVDAGEVAGARVRSGIAGLTASFAATRAAEEWDARAGAAVARERAEHTRTVRAVYAQGGGLGLRATLLLASDPEDMLWRVATVDRVIGDLMHRNEAELRLLEAAGAASAARVRAAEQADAAHGRTLEAAERDAAEAARSLDEAQRTLDGLDAAVRTQRAAVEAARRLAAARDAGSAGGHGHSGPVTALAIPGAYGTAYRAAAGSCPGLRWTLLAAVGQVESGHGRNPGPSSAGAIGPMQFMPATFRQYAVDGDHDGLPDPWDTEDAIWTAARYLCASGARGGTPPGTHDALFAYNRAEWYVQLVLATESAVVAANAG